MDLLNRSWGEGVQQMFVCIGGGGGYGSGAWQVIVKAMKEYGELTNSEKPITKDVGVFMTTHQRSEGSRGEMTESCARTSGRDAVGKERGAWRGSAGVGGHAPVVARRPGRQRARPGPDGDGPAGA